MLSANLFSKQLSNLTKRSFSSKKIMAANRGEISVRISRAANELGHRTVAIYSHEDRFTTHRYKADEAYLVGRGLSPVGAYLDIPGIVEVAKDANVDAIHPGYGFLSENTHFNNACKENDIVFVGPTVEQLRILGDKTLARNLAIEVGVPVIPGSPTALESLEDAQHFIEESGITFPVMVKAAFGGGGRGMREVFTKEEFPEAFERARSEAQTAFGNGAIFIEKLIQRPKHVEVQILGDGQGNVVHLFDRDCSVQRRHQKVIETAPALIPEDLREKLFDYAKQITAHINYLNAGTVEFLIDSVTGEAFFIEVNPRVQVEHTVTEEITGVDIVQSQINIAFGESLKDLGLIQSNVFANGYAMQCRVTTEDPAIDFAPTSGTLEEYRQPYGMGIRVDDGPGFQGANITPHYDSLLVKLTAHAREREETIRRMRRALSEFRVRGVTTNKSFLLSVLNDDGFIEHEDNVTTHFINENQNLLKPLRVDNRGQKLLQYIGDVIVNGPEPSLGAVNPPFPKRITPVLPQFDPAIDGKSKIQGLPELNRSVFLEHGAQAFAARLRERTQMARDQGLIGGGMLTDTTWRDAHQSLLATRMRTYDLKRIARDTSIGLSDLFSIEMWGGATFDVCLRFLKECPWDRLAQLRELVPNIPFQMLLRGANAVGYTSYSDNVVDKFCELAVDHGMDIFRVFDSLNFVDNLRFGADSVRKAGGIVECAMCYTGDVADPERGPYNKEYYLNLARQIVETMEVDILCIKDMAGLLTPQAATELVGALREEFPSLPIHVHTHDTSGVGVAAMRNALLAGADVVDSCSDAMSGMTSQPSMGALVKSLQGTSCDTGLDLGKIHRIGDFWEETRQVYAPFESGQKSGSSDVFDNEIPGGQYTNLLFQSQQLGLAGEWSNIKKAYADANDVLGDIIKVTPSSKVVGDLAQFMVQNKLTKEQVIEQAEELSFPQSVVEYFQGYIGIPPFGFPEPLRTRVLKGKKMEDGRVAFEGRPGAELKAYDFEGERAKLEDRWGEGEIRDVDLMSHALYPAVFEKFMESRELYHDLGVLDTRTFANGLTVGEEVEIEIAKGKTLLVLLKSVSNEIDEEGCREVIFQLNGRTRRMRVHDKSATAEVVSRPRAKAGVKGSVGAPMPGVVVGVKVQPGDHVSGGDPVAVLSAMKMETVVTTPVSGIVTEVVVADGDNLKPGDLIITVEEDVEEQK